MILNLQYIFGVSSQLNAHHFTRSTNVFYYSFLYVTRLMSFLVLFRTFFFSWNSKTLWCEYSSQKYMEIFQQENMNTILLLDEIRMFSSHSCNSSFYLVQRVRCKSTSTVNTILGSHFHADVCKKKKIFLQSDMLSLAFNHENSRKTNIRICNLVYT